MYEHYCYDAVWWWGVKITENLNTTVYCVYGWQVIFLEDLSFAPARIFLENGMSEDRSRKDAKMGNKL